MIQLSNDKATAMAIRVEDAVGTFSALLDGVDAVIPPDDFRRKTAVLMARDRIRHLEWVAKCLRGQSV